MMHLNTDEVAAHPPQKKPCWRDLHELTTQHLCMKTVKLIPLAELERHLKEIEAEHPHLVEETPLVVQHETRRRAKYHALQVVGSRTRAVPTALQQYQHA